MLYKIQGCIAQYLHFLHKLKTLQTHLSQRGLSILSKTKFRQDLPSPEFRHSKSSATGPLITLLLVSLRGGKEAPAKCWDKVSSWDTGYVSSHTATELVTSFQTVPSCFLWRCHIPLWILLAHHFLIARAKDWGIYFSSYSPLVSIWRMRSCQCFYLNSLFLWWTWGCGFCQFAVGGERGALFSPFCLSSFLSVMPPHSWC